MEFIVNAISPMVTGIVFGVWRIKSSPVDLFRHTAAVCNLI